MWVLTKNAVKPFQVKAEEDTKTSRIPFFSVSSLLTISSKYLIYIVQNDSLLKSRLSFSKTLFYLYLVSLSFRLLLTATLLGFDQQSFSTVKVLPVYLQYDFTLAFFASTGFLDGPQALVLSPGPLMMLYFDQVVHFTKGSRSYTFQIAYDILVTNKKNWQLFTTLVNQKLVWSFLSKRFSGFVVFKFREKRIKPLTHFAHLNGPIRKQAAIISFTFDLFIAFFVLGFGALLTFAVLWYSLAVASFFS